MSEPKPFASLSSGLLARKGAAKPAMRPQGFTQIGNDIEDLGWNDMGQLPGAGDFGQIHALPAEHVPSSIAALTPPPRASAEEPAVLEQQRKLESSFADGPSLVEPSQVESLPVVTSPVVELPRRERKPEANVRAKDKTAFTLRLDADRHLKLRLACAVMGRSAQQIVTGALDELLDSVPEIDALASRVPAKAGKRGR